MKKSILMNRNTLLGMVLLCMTLCVPFQINADPPDVASINMGRNYLNKNDFNGAILSFNLAILLNPNSHEAYFLRGVAYASLDEYDPAIEDFTRAIQLEHGDFISYYNRGYMYFRKGMTGRRVIDFEQAIADITQSIRLNSDRDRKKSLVDSYFLRATVYFTISNYDRAIADWEAVLRIEPDNDGARENIKIAQEELLRR